MMYSKVRIVLWNWCCACTGVTASPTRSTPKYVRWSQEQVTSLWPGFHKVSQPSSLKSENKPTIWWTEQIIHPLCSFTSAVLSGQTGWVASSILAFHSCFRSVHGHHSLWIILTVPRCSSSYIWNLRCLKPALQVITERQSGSSFCPPLPPLFQWLIRDTTSIKGNSEFPLNDIWCRILSPFAETSYNHWASN